jgi:hypothetical protein
MSKDQVIGPIVPIGNSRDDSVSLPFHKCNDSLLTLLVMDVLDGEYFYIDLVKGDGEEDLVLVTLDVQAEVVHSFDVHCREEGEDWETLDSDLLVRNIRSSPNFVIRNFASVEIWLEEDLRRDIFYRLGSEHTRQKQAHVRSHFVRIRLGSQAGIGNPGFPILPSNELKVLWVGFNQETLQQRYKLFLDHRIMNSVNPGTGNSRIPTDFGRLRL